MNTRGYVFIIQHIFSDAHIFFSNEHLKLYIHFSKINFVENRFPFYYYFRD